VRSKSDDYARRTIRISLADGGSIPPSSTIPLSKPSKELSLEGFFHSKSTIYKAITAKGR
jgi:hypothetical protein